MFPVGFEFGRKKAPSFAMLNFISYIVLVWFCAFWWVLKSYTVLIQSGNPVPVMSLSHSIHRIQKTYLQEFNSFRAVKHTFTHS